MPDRCAEAPPLLSAVDRAYRTTQSLEGSASALAGVRLLPFGAGASVEFEAQQQRYEAPPGSEPVSPFFEPVCGSRQPKTLTRELAAGDWRRKWP